MWLQNIQAHEKQGWPALRGKHAHAQAGLYLLGVGQGSVAVMISRGHSSDPVKLIFGVVAELPISKVPLNEAYRSDEAEGSFFNKLFSLMVPLIRHCMHI